MGRTDRRAAGCLAKKPVRDAAERDFFLVEGRPFDRGQKYAAPFNSDYEQWWYLAAGAVIVVGASLIPLLARRQDVG